MNSFYEDLGGHATLQKVHKVFYDKLYADPWLKHYFVHLEQTRIENQQTDFMAALFGGPKRYAGATPKMAHLRMYITEELLEARTIHLTAALRECGVSTPHQMIWLAKDKMFHGVISKKSPSEAISRYESELILNIPKPPRYNPN